MPDGTRVLVAPLKGVGREHPLSAEKLSPVLALYFTRDRGAGFDTCLALLRFGGLGHTCVIHGRDDAVIREYGLKMPAGRIVVNSPAPQGSTGSSTNLFPAMTLGCGAVGGNITSDNISPMHLINLRRLAYEARPVTQKEVALVTGVAAPAPTAAPCACQAGQKKRVFHSLPAAHRIAWLSRTPSSVSWRRKPASPRLLQRQLRLPRSQRQRRPWRLRSPAPSRVRWIL